MEDALQRGQDYLEAEYYEQALAAYEQALKLQPESAPAYVGKGQALDELYQPEASLAAYEQAVRLDPKNVDAWLGLSHLFWVYGAHIASSDEAAYEKALEASDHAIQLDPQNADAYIDRKSTRL